MGLECSTETKRMELFDMNTYEIKRNLCALVTGSIITSKSADDVPARIRIMNPVNYRLTSTILF